MEKLEKRGYRRREILAMFPPGTQIPDAWDPSSKKYKAKKREREALQALSDAYREREMAKIRSAGTASQSPADEPPIASPEPRPTKGSG